MKRYTIFVREIGSAKETALIEIDRKPQAIVKELRRKRFGERGLPVYGAVRVVDNKATPASS